MEVVAEFDQVLENIEELETGRVTSVGAIAEEYRALIKRGTCFVPYNSSDGLAFAPSRFIGYVGNKLATHANNPDRDGRITNAALNDIFGAQPHPDTALERLYLAFCTQLAIQPLKTGAFGVARKYWVTSEAEDFLIADEIEQINRDPKISITEKAQLTIARVGQGLFRQRLLSYWGKCCVTGCELQAVLRASHIKPWRHSSNSERLDVYNGLLLSPNFDALFDKGLISFDDTGMVLLSPHLSRAALKSLGCNASMKITVALEHAKYLSYHREKQFVGVAELPAG